MKHLLFLTALLLGASLFGQSPREKGFELLSADGDEIHIRYHLTDIEWKKQKIEGTPYFSVSVPHGSPMLEAGFPDLGKITTNIALQPQSSTTLEVLSTSTYTEYENIEIAPSKGNLYRDINPDNVPFSFGESYEEDAFYPSDLASLRSVYYQRNVRGQTVVFFPIQYNPVQKVLRVYDQLDVVIREDSEAGVVAPELSTKVHKGFGEIYKNRYLNYGKLANRYQEIDEAGHMLIISHADYMDQLQPYAEWKMRKGIQTQLLDFASIASDEFELKAFIQEYYDNNPLSFVLLVGDENAIPTMQTEIQNACDHCYSYLEGDDHYSEIFVGRFNGETTEEIQTMIDRNLEYEMNPNRDTPWAKNAMGVGSNEGPGDNGEFDFEHLNVIKNLLKDYTFDSVYEFYQGTNGNDSPTPGHFTADANGNPGPLDLVAAIESGVSVFNYTGHGGHTSLSTGAFDNNAVNGMENHGMYPYLVAVACCVGDFQDDFGSGPCLGDAWIRAKSEASGLPTGGIGGCFSSILQSWSPPMYGQDEMMKVLCDQGVYATRHTMGGVSMHGMGGMIDEYDGGGIEMADTWNIFGDPSTVLITDSIQDMQVDFVQVLPIGAQQMSVTCDTEGALVCLYHDGQIKGTAYAEAGVANLTLQNVDAPGTYYLTITAFNKMPVLGEVEVQVLSGPYITTVDYTIDDANGNGRAEYGELINVQLSIENVGAEDALSLMASISTTSTDVEMLSDELTIGDVEVGQTLDFEQAFSFDVNEIIVNGTNALFTIDIIDGNTNQWQSSISIPLYAPVVENASSYQVDITSGDGDLYPDPEESFSLTWSTSNKGGAISEAVLMSIETNNPYLVLDNTSFQGGTLDIEGSQEASFGMSVTSDCPQNEWAEITLTALAGDYADQSTIQILLNPIVEDFEDDELIGDLSFEGITPWFSTDYKAYTGTYSMQSGEVDDNEYTQMNLFVDVEEAGDLSFVVSVSTEESWDYLEFYIDGVLVEDWSGEIDWLQTTHFLEVGEHTLSWAYVKDELISDGDDAAWVDEILFPPLVSEPISSVQSSELNRQSLGIYPNPSSGNIVIDWSDLDLQGEDVNLKIYDMQARVLYTQTLDSSIHSTQLMDLGYLGAGMYIIELQNGQLLVNEKLIIQE